jgi:hypothetical protein
MRFVIFIALVFAAVPGYAQQRRLHLEADASRSVVDVGGNTQIRLTLTGLDMSDLGKAALGGVKPVGPVTFAAHIGYSPATPGIKKIGPFELEVKGELLRTGVVLVEAAPELSWGEEGVQFHVYPRKVMVGESIKVYMRQQYSGEPLVKTHPTSLNAKLTMRQGPDGKKVVEYEGPPKSWNSEGASSMRKGDKTYYKTAWRFDVPTKTVGKVQVTSADLPPLPPGIVFEPVEVEVVEPKGVGAVAMEAKAVPSRKTSEPDLTVRVQPQVVMQGHSIYFTIVLGGLNVADLLSSDAPGSSQPSGMTKVASFAASLESVAETPGEYQCGPLEIEVLGKKLVSKIVDYEILPEWPADAEEYEFHIFPRKVAKGEKIRVTIFQQYSAKPFLDIPYNNPRGRDFSRWSSPGVRSWPHDGRKMTRSVSTFDILAVEAGKKTITRDDLPPMDAGIVFEPLEVEVIEER